MPTAHAIFINRVDGRVRSGWAIAVFFAALALAGAQLVVLAPWLHKIGPGIGDLAAMWLYLGVTILATLIGSTVVREQLGASGFSDVQAGRRAALGFGMGTLLVAVMVGLPFLLGRLGLAGPGASTSELARTGAYQLAFIAPPSAAEEVMMRGFLLQQLIRGTGKVPAVLITGSLFGVGHLHNPNVAWLGIVNIVLAGIWLGILVVRSGSLWLTIGLHVAWNFTEGWVFGQAVSGQALGGTLLRATGGGSRFWTGGGFGPEASGLCTIVLLAAILAALAWRREPRRDKVV